MIVGSFGGSGRCGGYELLDVESFGGRWGLWGLTLNPKPFKVLGVGGLVGQR